MKYLIDIINEKLVLAKSNKNINDAKIYFYFEALENDFVIEFDGGYRRENSLEYSIDNCTDWKILNPKNDKKTLSVNKGQRIYLKCHDKIKSNCSNGIGTFFGRKKHNIGGNIMSLIYGDDFKHIDDMGNYTLCDLFKYNGFLVSAKDLILPATKLSDRCYRGMFCGCTDLEEGPIELPATELKSSCYNYMFADCTKLKKSPILYGENFASYCYSYMFVNCKSLKEITLLAKQMPDNIHKLMSFLSWTLNVLPGGKFIKYKSFDLYEDVNRHGNSIPKGWHIEEL